MKRSDAAADDRFPRVAQASGFTGQAPKIKTAVAASCG